MDINYEVSPTFMKVHKDQNRVIGVLGPVGSGKSTGMVFQLFFNAMRQRPDTEGVRHSRYAVIRATYPQLRSSTIKTFISWFKDKIRVVYSTPITATIKFPLDDGTSIDMELMFIAIEDEASAEKLRSFEFTGAWINEAHDVPRYLMTILSERINRYPALRDGGPVCSQILLDYNAVSTQHWLYKIFEEDKPTGFTLYKQPAAMIKMPTGEYVLNPEAENLRNLPQGYYENIVAVASAEEINTDVLNNYGDRRAGKPVYKDFDDGQHTLAIENTFKPLSSLPVIIGIDQGLTPAAVFTQITPEGTVFVFDEITTEDCSLREFAEERLWPKIHAQYPWIKDNFTCVIDPAAAQRSMNDAKAGLEILRDAGLPIKLAKSNSASERREAVIHFLRLRNRFKLNQKCTVLRKGFISDYKYEEKRSVDGHTYKETPAKNAYSHVHDALQYAMMEYLNTKPRRTFSKKTNSYQAASSIGGY